MADVEVRLKCSCEEAVRLTTSALESQGLKVACSFNLRDALNAGGMSYPHHGTEESLYDYVVLSVCQAAEEDRPVLPPNQIVIHGYRDNTWLSLPALDSARGRSQGLEIDPRLLRALAEVLGEIAM